jgi:hypothetical protein
MLQAVLYPLTRRQSTLGELAIWGPSELAGTERRPPSTASGVAKLDCVIVLDSGAGMKRCALRHDRKRATRLWCWQREIDAL